MLSLFGGGVADGIGIDNLFVVLLGESCLLQGGQSIGQAHHDLALDVRLGKHRRINRLSVIPKTVINIGSGQEISIGELAHKIASLMGKAVEIECENERKRPEGSEVERLCAANDLARKLLSWEPCYTLDEGLRLTIDWIGEHLEHYRPDAYAV